MTVAVNPLAWFRWLKGKAIAPGEELPKLIDEAPHLSRQAVAFARKLPSFTKGQLAFYALQKGRINQKDADVVLKDDEAASREYKTLNENCKSTRLGDAAFSLVLQAYQPPVNRRAADFNSVYSIAESTLDGDEFVDRVKELTKLAPRTKREGEGHRTILADAVRHNIIPTIALAELLSEHGVESPLTLTLPEVYLRLVKWFHPKVYERLKKDYSEGKLDVGLSNAHHSIAPLLSRDDLKREYEHSLEYYLKDFKPKNGEVSLHIPEQAKTEPLLDVLDEIQRKHHVHFTVYLDSMHHNPGVDLATATHFKYSNQSIGTRVFFRGYNISQNLAFQVTGGSDPLTNEERDTGVIKDLTPDRENSWFDREAGRIFNEVATNIFGRVYNDRTWRTPLYEGRNSVLTAEVDAEWNGFHNRGVPVALYRALKALDEFGVKAASTQQALGMVTVAEETKKHPHDASWGDGFHLWINPQTQWLRDLVSETLTGYKKPLEHMTDIMMEKNGLMEEQLPQPLKAAWENYGRSLLSCPYWWHTQPGYPENIPVIEELFRNMARCGRDLDLMEERMIKDPAGFNLTSPEVEELKAQHERSREAYGKFLNNPKAREYPSIRQILDRHEGQSG